MDYNIYNDSDYFYVAFCVTPWHLMGVKTFVRYVLDETPSLASKKGALVVIPHPRTGYCIKESDIKELNIPLLKKVIYSNADYNRLEIAKTIKVVPKLFKYRSQTLASRFIISTLEPYIFSELYNYGNIKNQLVLIDEGISSYTTTIEYIRHSHIESQSKAYALKLLTRLVIENSMKTLFRISVREWYLFNKSKGLEVDKIVSSYYQAEYNVICERSLKSKDYVLYLSQPPVTNEEKIYVPILLKKLADVCHENDMQFYVKKHPREENSYYENIYGVNLLDEEGPIEKIYGQLDSKPYIVLGYRSTALLTLKAFYNVRCVSLLPLLQRVYKKTLNGDDLVFQEKFGGHVAFVESFDDIKSLLKLS